MTMRLLLAVAMLAAAAATAHAGAVSDEAPALSTAPPAPAADAVDCQKKFGKYDRPAACENQPVPEVVKAGSVLPSAIDSLSGQSDSGLSDRKDPASSSDPAQ